MKSMSTLSHRLQLKVAQKQVLTPGLVQMVTVLQMNRLELKELINQEMVNNPVLEEGADASEEISPEELQPLLEGEAERIAEPADKGILDAMRETPEPETAESSILTSEFSSDSTLAENFSADSFATDAPADAVAEPASDPFDEIDFGSFFDEYLDPGHKSPASESIEKPSFETFLSQPQTLPDHLRSQLSVSLISDDVRDAAESIIGNLDEDGYITATLDEIAHAGDHSTEDMHEALKAVQSLEPAGVGARDLRECLLLQLESRGAKDSVAWQIVSRHLRLVETRQLRELAKILGRPQEHVEIAVNLIRHLNPRPGLRYSGQGARVVEPDVYFIKDGEDYVIQMNDEELPQLRLNRDYHRMLEKQNATPKEVRDYVRERYTSAIQLMKNIEQRKQTILKVCECIKRRQTEFLALGIDYLKPMMIKEVAEEVGVHPSTVSRAVASKYAHTPQGVFELRYFFSESVQGPSGGDLPLLLLKRKVKKMIEEENPRRPLTDEQITSLLQAEGIDVTRRTVAKYREDMKIPSTHQRRVRD
jgi:RNA polymerase sigma-54 factor